MPEPLIAPPVIGAGQWIVAQSDFKMILLLTGLAVLTAGLWLVWHHREQFRHLSKRLKQDSPNYRFEHRKHQRRTIVGGLVSSCGIVLAGFYWVQEGVAFAILLALLLLLTISINILAVLDMVSIGIKHSIEQLAEPDTETDQAIAAAIAKHHDANQNTNASTDDTL